MKSIRGVIRSMRRTRRRIDADPLCFEGRREEEGEGDKSGGPIHGIGSENPRGFHRRAAERGEILPSERADAEETFHRVFDSRSHEGSRVRLRRIRRKTLWVFRPTQIRSAKRKSASTRRCD